MKPKCCDRAVVLISAFLLFLGAAGTAHAAPAHQCQITTSPGALSFVIDPSLPGPISGTITAQASITCGNNTTFTVNATSTNGGATFIMKNGAGGYAINYNFSYLTGGSGRGTFNLITGGMVYKVYYQDAPVGSSYTDTIVLTVNFF